MEFVKLYLNMISMFLFTVLCRTQICHLKSVKTCFLIMSVWAEVSYMNTRLSANVWTFVVILLFHIWVKILWQLSACNALKAADNLRFPWQTWPRELLAFIGVYFYFLKKYSGFETKTVEPLSPHTRGTTWLFCCMIWLWTGVVCFSLNLHSLQASKNWWWWYSQQT